LIDVTSPGQHRNMDAFTEPGIGGYGKLARRREFRALWAGSALSTAATSMAGLALALLVHAESGSAFLTALVVFGPSLAHLIGASTLMSAADTVSPQVLLTTAAAVMAAAFAAQAVFDVAPSARLLIVVGASIVLSIASGARWGLLSQVVPADSYALARSAMNVSVGVMQVVGFAVGGALSALLQPSAVFWVAVASSALAGVVSWFGIESRPSRRAGRPGFRATWAGNAILFRQPSMRRLLAALCIPNGLVAGCEALFVSYSASSAAAFFMAGAAGMLTGDILMGRLLTPSNRRAATVWLPFLLPLPFLIFLWHPPLPVAVVMVGLASVGYAASLAQQELLVALTPPHLTGQLLGAESSARVACQGLAAVLAGALAELIPADQVIAILSVGSLLVSALLTPGLRRVAKTASRTPLPEYATH
jgi:predicted MFS family arabinose efflux permease